jgi:hypothetical protein
MSMVGFPLLLIPFAIYNIIAFLMPSVSFDVTLARLTLVSGAEWSITLSDVLLTLGILLLLLEVMKSARPGGKYLTDHLLSFLVLGATAAEFVMWQKFGTSTYFLLVLMAMVDFFSGIALRVRRAVVRPAPRTVVARGAPEEVKTVPPEPHVEPEPAPVVDPAATARPSVAPASVAPAPASAVPPAASVAESVLMDHPAPKVAQPELAKPVIPVAEPEPVAASVEHAPPVSESEPEPTVKAEEVKAQVVEAQVVEAQEVEPQEVKPQEVKPQEVKPQEVKVQEVKVQEVEAEQVPASVEPSPRVRSPESHPGASPPTSPETPKH